MIVGRNPCSRRRQKIETVHSIQAQGYDTDRQQADNGVCSGSPVKERDKGYHYRSGLQEGEDNELFRGG